MFDGHDHLSDAEVAAEGLRWCLLPLAEAGPHPLHSSRAVLEFSPLALSFAHLETGCVDDAHAC